MLVLSRRKNEGIIITIPPSQEETVIRLKVTDVQGGYRARLGFEAERIVTIEREELKTKI